jgi:hypothetical protein
MLFQVEVRDSSHLYGVIEKISKLDSVVEVIRMTHGKVSSRPDYRVSPLPSSHKLLSNPLMNLSQTRTKWTAFW